MTVYRIAKKKYAKDLSGYGVKTYGGRWNGKGKAMLYTNESRALAMAEVAVHIPYGILPSDFCLIEINIPNHVAISEIDVEDLHSDWDEIPHSGSTQTIGDTFIESNKYLVLKVPSVIVKGDYNFLINPHHAAFKKVKINRVSLFSFDNRLFNKK